MARAPKQDADAPQPAASGAEDRDPGLDALLAARDAVYAESAKVQQARDEQELLAADAAGHPVKAGADPERDPGLDHLLAQRDAAYADHRQAQTARDGQSSAQHAVYTTYQVGLPSGASGASGGGDKVRVETEGEARGLPSGDASEPGARGKSAGKRSGRGRAG